MKKLYFTLVLSLVIAAPSFAQLPDGSTAPDFTFTDISGATHNLYAYLNAGKYVAIEVSATWCAPCWAYHTSGGMDSLYALHDMPGDQTWKVFFIEGDGNTTLADLQGTTGSTQGNWTSGTSFPIMNPTGVPLNDFKAGYDINSFPMLYLVCPNKKVFHDTINKIPRGLVNTWNYTANTLCAASGLDDIRDANPLTIYPNPAKGNVVLYFALNRSTAVSLTVTNLVGQVVDTKNFGNLYPGDQQLPYDVSRYKAGMYFFTVTDGNNHVVRKKVVVQ